MLIDPSERKVIQLNAGMLVPWKFVATIARAGFYGIRSVQVNSGKAFSFYTAREKSIRYKFLK